MIKIWAILDDVGSEYLELCPIVLASNLEAIKTYIEENEIRDPTIVYKELDGAFNCLIEEEWNYWEGEKLIEYTWRNRKTGEFNPNFPNTKDYFSEDACDDWIDGGIYEVYKEGKLIKTYFCG
jgi:hypothetical protein